MCHKYLRLDLVNGELSKILPVADRPLVLLLALELEDQHLVAASVPGDGGRDLGLGQIRPRDELVGIAHYGNYAAHLNLRTDIAVDGVNLDRVARSNTVLLPSGFDNCVHSLTSVLASKISGRRLGGN